MCLAVPGQIIERLPPAVNELATATVAFDGLTRRVCIELVPEAGVGDYVIVHAGIAISRIDRDVAERLLEHLREIGDLQTAEDAP